MEHAKDFVNVIREEMTKLKNKLIRKTVVEGMSCEPGYIDVGDDGDCVKEVKTVSIFLTTPLANTAALAIFSFIFAGFLYKFKSTPLVINKAGTVCKPIDLNNIFNKNILTGIVLKNLYELKTPKDKHDFEKYDKAIFPWLDKVGYPAGVKPEVVAVGGSDDSPGVEEYHVPFGHMFLLPLYLTLKFSSQIYYKVFAIIKKSLYRHKQWGGIQEIDKISKGSWFKDFAMVFFIIPAVILFVVPTVYMLQIVSAFIITPVMVLVKYIQNNGSGQPNDPKMRTFNPDQYTPIEYTLTVLKIFGWLFLLMISGVLTTFAVTGLTALWFGKIITGMGGKDNIGPQIIFKTWGNIIWDYKYIWATLAICIWLLNFEIYLRGPHNLLTFVNAKNRDMALGIIAGVCVVLLLGKQAKFFKGLPKEKGKSRMECPGPNCNPPIDKFDPSHKNNKKNCPDPQKI